MQQQNLTQPDCVDATLPPQESAALAFQHMLASYASLIVTPMVLAGALGWSVDTTIFMLSACLITSGLCTLLQCIGIGQIGIRLPVVQGTTVATIPALIMIGANDGFTAMFGATIIAGGFTFLIAPWWSKLLRFFPPLVTGTVIVIIGLALFPVAVMWMSGGQGFGEQRVAIEDIILGISTLLIIMAVMRWGKGFISRIAILIGLVSGTLLGVLLGKVDFANVANAQWFGIITPFAMGFPTFKLSAILAVLVSMIVTMVESTGDYIAVGAVCDREIKKKHIAAGLRAEGLGTILGGVLNSFPYTTYAQNIGVLRVSGVRSRWVVALCGGFLALLGFFPKLSAIAACVPLAVLGGAGLILFGSIACTGLKILKQVDFDDNHNLIVVAVSLGLAMMVVCNPTFFSIFPDWVEMLLGNAITLGGLSALVLNCVFNGSSHPEEALEVAPH
ncbi:nucleobase:cation symporter-2 family protein [Ferrimonas aestuarii]|uniref:Purine permease n=1 Tax=Ferrimonas aestuarii TaxID=2569539 RepID=A0A4U1BSK4_9GAMM|nr:nucleobase:cation symporter-2 family protein [Ferrimonas aestuarii]TKB56510.1 purine permease [Ferrimonas aestuarii]